MDVSELIKELADAQMNFEVNVVINGEELIHYPTISISQELGRVNIELEDNDYMLVETSEYRNMVDEVEGLNRKIEDIESKMDEIDYI